MRLAVILAGVFGLGIRVSAADVADAISLRGVIDLHAHSAPDTVARSSSGFDVVRQARAADMRAVVLKNHYVPTAALAQLAALEVGGIEVFGGIVLNRAVGGLNAEAVRRMIQVEGKRGRIVWLPTFDAESQIAFSKEDRPSVPVVRDGHAVPALAEIFRIIAAADLVLATGHSSPEESIVLLKAAREAGVKRLLVTHVLSGPCHATRPQMKQMAESGALLEFTWLTHIGSGPGAVVRAAAGDSMPLTECVQAIREIGAEHFVITSDLGQANNPLHAVGLRAFIAALMAAGIGQRDVDLITRENPARLLGLSP